MWKGVKVGQEWEGIKESPESKMQSWWVVRGDSEIWHCPTCFKSSLTPTIYFTFNKSYFMFVT